MILFISDNPLPKYKQTLSKSQAVKRKCSAKLGKTATKVETQKSKLKKIEKIQSRSGNPFPKSKQTQ